VGRICDAFKNDDIDLTILLTHIGRFGQRAAAMLRPSGSGPNHRRAQPYAAREAEQSTASSSSSRHRTNQIGVLTSCR